jgi:hypothetical protein
VVSKKQDSRNSKFEKKQKVTSPLDVSRISFIKLIKEKLSDVISTDSSLSSSSGMNFAEKNYYAVAVGKTPGIFFHW